MRVYEKMCCWEEKVCCERSWLQNVGKVRYNAKGRRRRNRKKFKDNDNDINIDTNLKAHFKVF